MFRGNTFIPWKWAISITGLVSLKTSQPFQMSSSFSSRLVRAKCEGNGRNETEWKDKKKKKGLKQTLLSLRSAMWPILKCDSYSSSTLSQTVIARKGKHAFLPPPLPRRCREVGRSRLTRSLIRKKGLFFLLKLAMWFFFFNLSSRGSGRRWVRTSDQWCEGRP